MKETLIRTLFITFLISQPLLLTACGSGGGSSSPTQETSNSSNNEATAPGFAYISGYTGTTANSANLSICKIETDGQLKNCSSQNIKTSGSVLLYNNNSRAIFGQESNIVTCQVKKIDGNLYNCNNVDTNIQFKHNAHVIGLMGNYIYISDDPLGTSPAPYACSFSTTNKSMSCELILKDLSQPISMTLDTKNNRAYFISNYGKNSQIVVCNVDSATGKLGICNTANDSSESQSFNYAWDLLVDPSGKYMYVVNTGSEYGQATVSICTIDANTGNYTQCTATGNGLSFPHSIALDPTGHYAFFINSDATMSKISSCVRNAENGELSNCIYTANNISMPTWISTFR